MDYCKRSSYEVGSCLCLEIGELQMTMMAANTSFQGLITKEQVMQIVKEELKSAEMRISTKVESLFKDANNTLVRNNMKLEFKNKISQEILTGEEIKGVGDIPIEVALVDDPTGNIVDAGPEASASVEIVLLKGETDALEEDQWTVEEFNKNIVPEVKDKKPLLAGNVPLKLQSGIGVVKNISFRHHASKIRPPKFKLGARVVGAFGGHPIKEAKTGSFTLKDFRKKYSKKHETPSLSDEVFRLANIGKGGDIDKRLRSEQIKTVEDFLIQLLINPEGLKRIVKLCPKRWEATVNNARAGRMGSRVYCYIDPEQKIGVVFNILGQVLLLYFQSQNSLMSALSENQKAYALELLTSAYKNWGDVKAFDDVSSLQQHYAGLSTNVEPMDSLKPYYPGGGHGNTGMSEMIGESSNRCSNILFHSVSSTMNLTRETGREDLGWFTDNVGIMHPFGETRGVDFGRSSTDLIGENRVADFSGLSTDNGGIMYDAVQLSPNWPLNMLQDDHELFQQNYSCNMQLDGLINKSNADQFVYTSNPPKRWKRLFWCIKICKKWYLEKKLKVY